MKNKNSSKIAIVFEIILIIISVGYFIYSLIFIKDSQLFNIINSFLLVFFAVMLLLNQLTNKSYYKIISIIVVIGFALCNVLNSVSAFTKNIISLGNFSNKNINDVLVWAKENNIEIEQIYEYSDNIKEFFIISQDIDSNIPLKDVTKLKLIVSSGPNYNKEVIIPNLVGYILFGEISVKMISVLIGSFIILITGIIDDIKPIDAKVKLVGQILAALVVVFYGNIILKDISAFGLYLEFGIFAYPVTVLFIVACINCVNLIDGLDGLAAGISSIFFLTIGIITFIKGEFGLPYELTFILLGASLGFLAHNFYPASIFMGDSGSMFLGFIIAVITLLGFKNVMMSSIIIPLLILAIPILDTLFAIIRRSLKGESISKPDKFHIHHQLLKRNFSQRTTVLIIYAINILFSTASIVYVLKNRELGYIIYGLLLIIVVTFIMKTNVVVEHKRVDNNEKK